MLIWERRLAVITTTATDLAIQYDELIRLRARVKRALAAASPHGGRLPARTAAETSARLSGPAVIVGNSIRLASEVELGDALG
jgi:hypothetical protein